jgi:hypothetical protein
MQIFEKPYFVITEGLPGLDFNREIFEPGTNENFPDGVVGIRVDDDFWAVAALPFSYVDKPLAELVAEFWAPYVSEATLCPDSGSVEQRIYHVERMAEQTIRKQMA